jgi:6-phosphofructokinase 1
MPSSVKRIGILTGGGDCAGLNAVIRAVTKTAIRQHLLEVIGIADGFQGLAEDRMQLLTFDSVSNILTQGGTILGTNNKYNPSRVAVKEGGVIRHEDHMPRCMDNLARRGIDALIVIGGDGTMSCASLFVQRGINCIGVPKTIDNDLYGTDVTFGFQTAVHVATAALDRIHTTAASHHRAMVVELMGRNAGWITLHAGIASGSDVILLPEIPFDLNIVCDFVVSRARRGKRFSILAVAEGARPRGGQQVVAKMDPTSPDPIRLGGIGQQLAAGIEERTGIETRTTVLGHVQRGGSPVADDRVLATEFGHAAINLLMRGGEGRLVVMRGRTVTDIPLLEAAGRQRLVPLDDPKVIAARQIEACFGD